MNQYLPIHIVCLVLILTGLASAVGCIYSKHQSRKLFTELQAMTKERDRLEVEWGRLQIEQSTWSTHARVERLAREQMRMRTPVAGEILLVRP
jgi:cell division protein FtsL